ncbi:proto-oncogene serine/threonine-protein kinase mos [Latimeria chalumnae]|uniref:proto-oncogene serine/threonine-protein kinase mos n=1 Tax=Latimeria chalumnae TaxID=7897 RepID=UPI0003C12036|nr:PREDICTED: proto-oncogene serine/threonine-protein kinase mos [Latimeria chalumnae]|eukprot:XP_005993485.1 PREDICTED: proto-oncogene serine/threonine-protein kinase mos [Latimeria chalumnae]
MPSPIPLTRLLPREFSPSVNLRPCSSPCELHDGEAKFLSRSGLSSPRLAWCTINWEQLRLLQRLGSGGFGSVYKGTYYGKTVAVKKVKKSTKNKLASRQSFWAELNTAHLSHHNIVRVVAATACVPEPENQDNLGTIIMEYAGNTTLHHRIYSSAEPLGLQTCLKFSIDVLQGLVFLHSHGVVHLDLKPANVLITEQEVCKIGDFGCSQKLPKGTDLAPRGAQVYHLGGTYTHRAPELLKGGEATRKADIYSFAITLWQMITREQPFSGDRQCVLYAVVAYNLRPTFTAAFSTVAGGQELRGLLDECWNSDPSERPSAKQLLTNLSHLQKST